MKRAETLKELCKNLIRYVGAGYFYIKITHIPKDKIFKKDLIMNKIKNQYETDLTQGKRQYKRKQGKANYAAMIFKEMIIILHTEGSNLDQKDEFLKISPKGLKLKISDYLTLILFKDQRDIWTFKLSNDFYRGFKGKVETAIKNRKGQDYYNLVKMWKGLPIFKGIGQQKTLLNIFVKELLKENKLKWGLF